MATPKISMAAGANRDMPKLMTRDGIFYVIFFDLTVRRMRRYSLRTRDFEVAKVAFGKCLVDFPKGPMRPKRPVSPPRFSVVDALDLYEVEHVAIDCADPGRQRHAALYLRSYFREAYLDEIDIVWFRGYADARRRGLIQYTSRKSPTNGADSSIRRELTVLKAAANHAYKFRKIREPVYIELPKAWDLADSEAKFFSREQIALLIFNARGETRDFVKLCYFTGARRASIEKLTVAQIDFDRRNISLATPGRKRTKKRQPIVPLFPWLEPDLRRLVKGKQPTDRILQPRYYYGLFTDLCRSLGFPEPYNPHMLRHSRATHLLQDGKKLYSVAALLGDTTATIERYYAHSGVAELLEALS